MPQIGVAAAGGSANEWLALREPPGNYRDPRGATPAAINNRSLSPLATRSTGERSGRRNAAICAAGRDDEPAGLLRVAVETPPPPPSLFVPISNPRFEIKKVFFSRH